MSALNDSNAGPPPRRTYKRSLKNLWLNPRFQGRYIFWISLTGLLLVALNSGTFYAFTRENYATLVDLSPMTDDAKSQLYKELWQIVGCLVGGNLIFLFLVSILGLFYSHRTAGPLYHYKRVFTEIKNGNYGARVRLRPTDDFQDVAAVFNEMMDTIQSQQKK